MVCISLLINVQLRCFVSPRERERESADLILANFAYNISHYSTTALLLYDLVFSSRSVIAPEKTPAVVWSEQIQNDSFNCSAGRKRQKYPIHTGGKLANCVIFECKNCKQKLSDVFLLPVAGPTSGKWALRTLIYFELKKTTSTFISGEHYSEKNVEIFSGFNF